MWLPYTDSAAGRLTHSTLGGGAGVAALLSSLIHPTAPCACAISVPSLSAMLSAACSLRGHDCCLSCRPHASRSLGISISRHLDLSASRAPLLCHHHRIIIIESHHDAHLHLHLHSRSRYMASSALHHAERHTRRRTLSSKPGRSPFTPPPCARRWTPRQPRLAASAASWASTRAASGSRQQASGSMQQASGSRQQASAERRCSPPRWRCEGGSEV